MKKMYIISLILVFGYGIASFGQQPQVKTQHEAKPGGSVPLGQKRAAQPAQPIPLAYTAVTLNGFYAELLEEQTSLTNHAIVNHENVAALRSITKHMEDHTQLLNQLHQAQAKRQKANEFLVEYDEQVQANIVYFSSLGRLLTQKTFELLTTPPSTERDNTILHLIGEACQQGQAIKKINPMIEPSFKADVQRAITAIKTSPSAYLRNGFKERYPGD